MRTPLHGFHLKHGHVTEYAGFELPLWYRSPVEEHLAVRHHAGIFDTSHMGRIIISGEESAVFLDYLLTNSVSELRVLKARHAFLCNEDGGVVDDIMTMKLEDKRYLLIVNAINRLKDLEWLHKHRSRFKVDIDDQTREIPMIAVQGPKAVALFDRLVGENSTKLKRMWAFWTNMSGVDVLAMRTGYTGEDGLELLFFTPAKGDEACVSFWKHMLDEGSSECVEPCGLAARDSLRLEAGLCLSGNELNEHTSPLEARMSFGVRLENREFIGIDALRRQLHEGLRRIRIGFKMEERGIPRTGMDILKNGRKIGSTTSGTLSPLLRAGIGMGYVQFGEDTVGEEIQIDIRGRLMKAITVKMPFYNEELYGWRRTKT